jgi:2-polyprenyl-3-methyl-5-hydroxy-6-metoxy-1,4-benzoquinol methylase
MKRWCQNFLQPRKQGRLMTDDYAGYSVWKQWNPSQFMVCGPYERRYYKGEFRGLDLSGRRILELGFGNGGFLRYATDQGARISGTELLAEARASAAERGVRVYALDLSDALTEDTGNFDIVVAFDVMEHLTREQLLVLFESLAKLLKSGGHVLARFPNAQSPLGCVTQNGDWTHRSALSGQVLMQLLVGKPWTMVRAENPFTVVDADSALKRIGMRLRYATRRGVEWTLAKVYGIAIALDPNVTVLLRRD